MKDVLHTESAGSVKHGPPEAPDFKLVPDPRPDGPITFVNDTEPPGKTIFDSAVASGAAGGVTVGVIVDAAFCPKASTAT